MPNDLDLNGLLQAVVNAEASLQATEADVAEAQERRTMAAEALAREQSAFDAAVKNARTLARPSPSACVDTGAQVLQESLAAHLAAAMPPPETPVCEECGQPSPAGHVCRKMDGAPGPIPANSPANHTPPPCFTPGASGFRGPMPLPGYAPEDGDDRPERTGED